MTCAVYRTPAPDGRFHGLNGQDTIEAGDGDDTIVSLGRRDVIDLSATGLEYDDLTITETGSHSFPVEYGDQGGSIDVTLNVDNFELTADDVLF